MQERLVQAHLFLSGTFIWNYFEAQTKITCGPCTNTRQGKKDVFDLTILTS